MIKIIADTTCTLVPKITKENKLYKFNSAPIGVTIDNVNYLDEYENGKYKQQESFLKVLNDCKDAPKSFAPSPEVFYNAICNDDSDTVFIVTLTSKLSGTYNSAMLAKSMCEDEGINKNIFVIDSKSSVTGITNVILKIIEGIENGEDVDKIYNDTLKYIDEELTFYLVLKSLKNLERNGRVSPTIAKLATLMNMRPICIMTNGEIKLAHKPRGDKAYKKIIDLIKNDNIDYSTRTLVISNINNEEVAKMIKEEVSKFANFKDILISNDLTYIATMYAENGGIILSY